MLRLVALLRLVREQISEPKNQRIYEAALNLFEAIAEATDSPVDDWIVERLRALGLGDDQIDQFLKPDRIQ
jgi:hypothetical protein